MSNRWGDGGVYKVSTPRSTAAPGFRKGKLGVGGRVGGLFCFFVSLSLLRKDGGPSTYHYFLLFVS